MDDHIPLFEIAWDERDISNAVESISRGSYWAKGPFVDAFEAELEAYLDVEHAVTLNSGTEALVAALRAGGIGSGDEVIVPSMTFIATANAVRLVGADPVFADIEPESYGLDPSSVREKITAKTEGIIPVHLYGGPCRIEDLSDIAREFDLVVIEDAAEAFGASYREQHVGTFGDAGIFSFCQNKIVVTGEGGAVVTDDDELAENVRLYRSHGRTSGEYFERADSGEYATIGTNTRMSDLTAAVGCSQLQKVDDLIRGRQRAARKYNDELSDVEGVGLPAPRPEGQHVYQLYTVRLPESVDRSLTIETLDEHGVSSKIYWDTPVHQTEYYRTTWKGSDVELPETESAAETLLTLPMYPELSNHAIERIANAFKAGVSRGRRTGSER